NCRTFRTGVSRWFYKFLSKDLAMWPPGHTSSHGWDAFVPAYLAIKTQPARRSWPETTPLLPTSVGPRSGAEGAALSVSGTVTAWIARRTVGSCSRPAEGSTGNDRQRFASENG